MIKVANQAIGAIKAMTNMGPGADSSYYQAMAAAQGVGVNASAACACDMSDFLFAGLDADAHAFAMSVISNSNKPVTSVNQQTVLPSARVVADGDYWKQVMMGGGITQALGTLPVNPVTKGLPSIGVGVLGMAQGAGNSTIIKDINNAGAWLENTAVMQVVNSINPAITGAQALTNAYQAYHSGNSLNAVVNLGIAGLAVIPAGGIALSDARAAVMYLSSKIGGFWWKNNTYCRKR